MLARFVAAAAFPATLGLTVGLTSHAMAGGAAPADVTGQAILAAAIVVLVLERLFPYHRSWLRSHDDVRVDLGWAVTIGALDALMRPALFALAVFLAGAIGPGLDLGLWPREASWLLQLPLALVVAELPKYWHHRLQHETDLLWRFHATHHSAPRLYFLNASRFHPIDTAIDLTIGGVPLLVLGCPTEVFALFGVVSGVHGFFQHANLQIRIGPLNYLFSMAELHRWHHSKTIHEANHNYGQNLIVWDLVFGTFFWPRDRQPPEEIGIPDLPAFPTTWWQQLLSPFRWRRIRAASRALGDARAA